MIPPAGNSGISKSIGWAIIEELSIRRRVRTFLVSWGQTTRVKNCYVDLWVLVSNDIYRYERNFLPQSTNFRDVLIASMCHWPPSPQAESRQLAVNTRGCLGRFCVCSWFVCNWRAKFKQNIIVLCICHHDNLSSWYCCDHAVKSRGVK